jgi:hypothetical protein
MLEEMQHAAKALTDADSDTDERLVLEMEAPFERIHQELDTQVKRTAEIQVQVDELLGRVRMLMQVHA